LATTMGPMVNDAKVVQADIVTKKRCHSRHRHSAYALIEPGTLHHFFAEFILLMVITPK
jgi:hypothetical protein